MRKVCPVIFHYIQEPKVQKPRLQKVLLRGVREAFVEGSREAALSDISVQAYNIPDSASDAISWYRGQMIGWEKMEDNVETASETIGGVSVSIDFNILIYIKGNELAEIVLAEIVAWEFEGDTYLVLAYFK